MDENKIKNVLLDFKNKSNKELTEAMDFLNEDFEKTKEYIVKMTYHLDGVERAYNKLLEEYQKRNKK
jgi:prefoldin subunit 5